MDVADFLSEGVDVRGVPLHGDELEGRWGRVGGSRGVRRPVVEPGDLGAGAGEGEGLVVLVFVGPAEAAFGGGRHVGWGLDGEYEEQEEVQEVVVHALQAGVLHVYAQFERREWY